MGRNTCKVVLWLCKPLCCVLSQEARALIGDWGRGFEATGIYYAPHGMRSVEAGSGDRKPSTLSRLTYSPLP